MASITARQQQGKYEDWKAPQQDGGLLIWPEPREALLEQTRGNQGLLSGASVKVQNVPLAELRQSMRAWIGHEGNDRPLIGTGHQTELFHPGVWVKDVVIDSIAKDVGGEAYHFAVDTDEPKHLSLRWPGVSLPLTDDPALGSASWSGLLASPTPGHVTMLETKVSEMEEQWRYRSQAGQFLAAMKRLSLEEENLSKLMTRAMHDLDWELGLRHHAMVTSPMLVSPAYLVFVHHVMARGRQFATQYNAALAEYRLEQGIKTPGRPMPDLKIETGQCESPFWVDCLQRHERERATLVDRGGKLALKGCDNNEFLFDPEADGWQAAEKLGLWLRQNRLRLSPRALTLTCFLRMVVVDQWVHGIGGGRYDQVLDKLIERHFAMQPPGFAVATATLFFPGALGRERVCVRCVRQEGHRLKHSVLGEEKRMFVERMEAMPRRSRERAMTYSQMQRRLREAGEELVARWETKLRETEKREAEEAIIFDRELFYAIQSRERLAGLREKCSR